MRRGRPSLFSVTFVVLVLAALTACEPEVGSPCSEDPAVMDLVDRQETGNTLRQDLNFENCSRAFCMSTDNSRPYCTNRCESDLECGAPGFTCEAAIRFGTLGCKDWNPDTECNDSELPYRYCTAESAAVIADRDNEYDRTFE